jgi:hypothetical protein
MQVKTRKGKIDGNHIIYHYIQKNLVPRNDSFSKELIERLIVDLSIWLPVEYYREMPLLFPYALRDQECRKNRSRSGLEEWGSANEMGFFRDDNTLIKGVVKPLSIKSRIVKEYDGSKPGDGFTACHIWRTVVAEGQRIPSCCSFMTYSFIPNLVWLPKQVAKFTDRDGSYAQLVLEKISCMLYTGIRTDDIIRKLWSMLPEPDVKINVDVDSLNFFEINRDLLQDRRERLKKEIENIIELAGSRKESKVHIKCSRYVPSLITVEQPSHIKNWLNQIRNLVI